MNLLLDNQNAYLSINPNNALMNNIVINVVLVCLLLSNNALGQKEDNIWPLGEFAGVDFLSGIGTPFSDENQMYIDITNAALSDSTGDLLFYSNGIAVANKWHDTLVNGNNLSPGKYTPLYNATGMPIAQGAIISPFSSNKSKYYLFNLNLEHFIPGTYIAGHLYYSVVDMSLNGA